MFLHIKSTNAPRWLEYPQKPYSMTICFKISSFIVPFPDERHWKPTVDDTYYSRFVWAIMIHCLGGFVTISKLMFDNIRECCRDYTLG